MDLGFHRPQGDPLHLGDLVVLVPLDITEYENGPGPFGKGRNGPFDVHPVRGDPTFGFLSGLELRMALPMLGLAVGGGMVAGIVIGSWKLWARRKHAWAVLVSSLPLLLFAVVLVISIVEPDWAS